MKPHERAADDAAQHYRLIASVKRGVSSDFDELNMSYPTVDAARAAARALSGRERIGHVLIARDEVPPIFVEWVM
jgi:hypothetical protein